MSKYRKVILVDEKLEDADVLKISKKDIVPLKEIFFIYNGGQVNLFVRQSGVFAGKALHLPNADRTFDWILMEDLGMLALIPVKKGVLKDSD